MTLLQRVLLGSNYKGPGIGGSPYHYQFPPKTMKNSKKIQVLIMNRSGTTHRILVNGEAI